jgi:hypothetical protein
MIKIDLLFIISRPSVNIEVLLYLINIIIHNCTDACCRALITYEAK